MNKIFLLKLKLMLLLNKQGFSLISHLVLISWLTVSVSQYAPILGSSQYSPPLGSSSDNSAVRSGQYNRTQSEIEPTSRVEPPDYTSAVQDQCGVETCTDVQGLYGVETCTGTLKRSHSVGVSAAKSFDRHNPARQSIAGDNDLRELNILST